MTTDDELKELVKKMKFAPTREWANTYFDLMKQVLDVTGLIVKAIIHITTESIKNRFHLKAYLLYILQIKY